MKQLLTLPLLLLCLFAASQTRTAYFDYSLKPAKHGSYYFVETTKQDSVFQRRIWYLSQKTLYMEGWYKDEQCTVEQGIFKWYHSNKYLRETGSYANGRKEGVWLRFDNEGNLTDSSNYEHGWRKGIGLSWHKNGFLSDSANFDGAGNGVQVQWYDDGSLAAAGYRKQDTLKLGRWKYFDHEGKVIATEDFDDKGQLTLCNCYDEKGVPLDTSLCREKEASVNKQQWIHFMQTSLQPLIEQKAADGMRGEFTVGVQFVVDEKGQVGEVKALTNFGHGIEEAVVNIFKRAPAWEPGRLHGRNVKSYHTQPVSFAILSN